MATSTKAFSVGGSDNPDDLGSSDEIEAGSLIINTSGTQLSQIEVWERPASYKNFSLPEDGTPLLIFEILSAYVMPPEGVNLNVKRYVVYDLCLRQNTIFSVDKFPARIKRRYTHFRELYNTLKQNYPKEMANIKFPNKAIVGNFSSKLAAERVVAFEELLTHISGNYQMRDTITFLDFLQKEELTKACRLLDERNNDASIPILENSFILLNKIFTDRSKPVLLTLCRLVVACTISPVPHPSAEKWTSLALKRYETVCDIDLLPLYVPLLRTCANLWWKLGRDQKLINDRLTEMYKQGINTTDPTTLMQAIHKLDPRSEII